jgi:hypothetical protein
MQSEFVNLTTHTHQRAERENDAITMRLRAIRTEVTINGQDSRHGKRITRAAALVFFLVTFSKVKKLPSAGRNPASPRPRRARGGDGIPALSSAPRAAGRNPASPVPRGKPRRFRKRQSPPQAPTQGPAAGLICLPESIRDPFSSSSRPSERAFPKAARSRRALSSRGRSAGYTRAF